MKKQLVSLYLIVPLILLMGWFSVRDNEEILIRRDALEGSIALGISALLLTIGHITERLVLSAKILKVGAILYIGFILTRLTFDCDWSNFSWWLIPLGLLATVFICFPACVAYLIASAIIKEANKSR